MKLEMKTKAKGQTTTITFSINPHVITVLLTMLLHFAGVF